MRHGVEFILFIQEKRLYKLIVHFAQGKFLSILPLAIKHRYGIYCKQAFLE